MASDLSCDTRDSPTPMTSPNLCERHLLLVIHREDVPLARRELLDGARQVLAQLCALQPHFGTVVRIEAQIQQPALSVRIVDRPNGAELQRSKLLERASVRGGRHVERRGNLFLGRLPSQFVTQAGKRDIELAAHLAKRARRPVEVAQRVEHRTLHAAARKRVERYAERGAIPTGGVHQPQHPDADQIRDLHLRWQPLCEAMG